jgi:acyl dehydratase
MTIDPSAVGTTTDPVRRSWSSKDSLLYAIGVGAGQDPLDELAFTTENTKNVEQRVLPTMAIVVGFGGGLDRIGSYDRTKLVHGAQAVELHRPIPVAGEIECVGEITGIYDKGSGALVEITSRSTLVDGDGTVGEPLFTTVGSFFIREAGQFGGERGPSSSVMFPDREPDAVRTYTTRPEQALIYRLSGDRNPLHADPTFAARAGFDRPILHGLCTYGFTGRALLHALCDGDPTRFRSMSGRFSKPVMPGDELVIRIWRTADGEAAYRTETADGRVVLDDGTCAFARGD